MKLSILVNVKLWFYSVCESLMTRIMEIIWSGWLYIEVWLVPAHSRYFQPVVCCRRWSLLSDNIMLPRLHLILFHLILVSCHCLPCFDRARIQSTSTHCTFIGVKPVATFTAYFKFAFCSQQAGWWPEVPGVAEMTLYKGTIMICTMIDTMIDTMIRVMMDTVMTEEKQLAPISTHRQFSNSWNVFTAGKT